MPAPGAPARSDRSVMGELLVGAGRRLRGYVRRLLRRGPPCNVNASDVVQSAVARALRRPAALPKSDPRRLLAYVRAAAKNRVLDLQDAARALKRSPQRGRLDDREPQPAEPIDLHELSTAGLAARNEEAERLRAAIATLDPEDRALIELHYFRGLGPTELARELGIDRPDAARIRVARAVQRLATRLLADRPGERGGGGVP